MSRFKALQQLEMTDCGPTCVQMICTHYGKPHSLHSIKRDISISRIGVTVGDVKRACERAGLETVAVMGTAEKLRKAPLPAILHWRGVHFVVLYKVKPRKKGCVYYIADPSYGKIRFGEEEFERHWQGDDGQGLAILARPGPGFDGIPVEKEKTDFTIVKYLLRKMWGKKSHWAVSVGCLLLAAMCNWAIPVLYQRIVDDGVLAGSLSVVVQLFLAQLAFFIGYIVSNAVSSVLLVKLNFHVGIDFLSQLLGKMIRLPMKYFDTRLNTDFIQRLDDYGRLQSFLTDTSIAQLFAVVNIAVCSSLLFVYSPLSLALFFLLSAAGFAWNAHFLRTRKHLDYSRFTEQARNRNILYELINGMPDIKANNAQATRVGAWEENQRHINEVALKSIVLENKQSIGGSTINKLRDILIVALCAYFTINGDMTVGVLLSVSYILGQLSAPINRIQRVAQNVQDAKISIDRLAEVQLKEEEATGTDRKDIPFSRAIELRNVTFKYEGSFLPNVFESLNVAFPKNKTTAIVGNSGSGKTTLAKLIVGFYTPQKGAVEIDGSPLSHFDVSSWRDRCGVVMQDGYIFSATIAENIALGDKEIDYGRVAESGRLACIDDFVSRLPSGYRMKIGKSGLELSQGQKQRILIARAVYKNPELIILDEATSSLDTINERQIMDNLQGFLRERTVIIIAHRLSTVVRADNIIFLENGKIAEQGTHGELVKLRGKYYSLIKNQLELESD